jgi:hypothetical protein
MKQLRAYRVPLAVNCLAGIPLLRLHFIYTPSAPIGVWRAQVGDVITFCMKPDQTRQTRGRPYAGGAAGGRCPFDTWALAKPLPVARHTPLRPAGDNP